MDSEQQSKSKKQNSDEYLQILKSKNGSWKGKAVFKKLYNFIESESEESLNKQSVNVETRIHNIENKKEVSAVETAIGLYSNTIERESKEDQKIKGELSDDKVSKRLKVELISNFSPVNVSDSQISLNAENKKILNENPFEMSKHRNLLCSELKNSVENLNIQDQNIENKDDSCCLNIESNYEKSDCAIENLDPLTDKNEANNDIYPLSNSAFASDLQYKIDLKRRRSKTICDLSDIRSISTSELEIFATNHNEVEKSPEKVPDSFALSSDNICQTLNEKIKNKRLRNRTVCFDNFFDVNAQNISVENDDIARDENLESKIEELPAEEKILNDNVDFKTTETSVEDQTNDNLGNKIDSLDSQLTKILIEESKNSDIVENIAENKDNQLTLENIKQVKDLGSGKVSALAKEYQKYINRSDDFSSSESVSKLRAEKNQAENSDHMQKIEKNNKDTLIACEKDNFVSFKYIGKYKVNVYDINVENKELKTRINKHIIKQDNDCAFDENIMNFNSKTAELRKEQSTAQKSMTGINDSDGNLKPLECSNNMNLRLIKSNHKDLSEKNRNKFLKDLNKKTDEYLTKFAIAQLKKKIRNTGFIASVKKFFTLVFSKKWYKKKLEKLNESDAFFISLHEYIFDNFTNTSSMFRLSADRIYYTEYPKRAAKKEYINFNLLTPHEISALYKGYIRNIFKGLISSKIGKYLVNFLKLKNVSEVDKRNYLIKVAPNLVSSVERSYLKDIFRLWDVIADNYENTKMDIASLCIVFAPSIINDSFITDITDSLFLPKILECFYMSDLDRVDNQFYQKFEKKCKKNEIF